MTKKKAKPCPYWVWSKDSNVHVAISKEWFTNYTPFKSTVLRQKGKKVAAIGIGTVYLSMRRALSDDTPFAFDIFKMDDVLHVPSAPGNVIGGPLDGMKIKYDISPAGRTNTAIVNAKTGCIFGYFHPGWEDLRLLRVAVGIKQQCTAEEGSAWLARISEEMTAYTWPAEARAAWAKTKNTRQYMHPDVAAAAASSVYSSVYPPMVAASASIEAHSGFTLVKSAAATAQKPAHSEEALTSDEKAWLHKHFGTEHAFLREHDLYIHVERDRETGRQILRAMMESGCMSEDERGTEQDPEQLDREERLWVRKHFGSEYNCLKECNLFIHVAQQRREGWSIIRSMIASGCMSDSECEDSDTEPARMADKGVQQTAVGDGDANGGVYGRYAVQQHEEQVGTAKQPTQKLQIIDYSSDDGANGYGQDGRECATKSATSQVDAYYMDQWPVVDGVEDVVVTSAITSKPHQWSEPSLLD